MVIFVDGRGELWYTEEKEGSAEEVDGMKQAVDVATMRKSDAETIRAGVSGRELMARAAKGIFESYAYRGPTAIVCGYGNNAGDGFALALLLKAAGIDCTVWILEARFSEDGAYFYEKCKENAVKTAQFTAQTDLSGYAEVVDCIFGTGFRGAVEGLAKVAIEAINHSGAYVISADINSGLCGDNGRGACTVKSDLTVSIGFYKNGHFLGRAKDLIGRLCNVDIGIGLHGRARGVIEREDLCECFPKRANDSHKGTYGYVSILGGCREYAGAVKLANLSASALRAGCGVAKLIIPESIYPSVAPYLLESTAAPMADLNGHIRFDADALDAHLAGQRALAIGMGWGKSPENTAILRHILTNYEIPVVIDADGLNTLATMDLEILRVTNCRVILTPHMGEMARLCGKTTNEIADDPIGTAEDFAGRWGVCLLLKGATTVVSDGEETYLVDRGCAGMATAGSGDVLSGVLVGMLGFNPPTAKTVAAAAYLTGRAGEMAADDVGEFSMIASDTVSKIPAAIREFRQ